MFSAGEILVFDLSYDSRKFAWGLERKSRSTRGNATLIRGWILHADRDSSLRDYPLGDNRVLLTWVSFVAFSSSYESERSSEPHDWLDLRRRRVSDIVSFSTERYYAFRFLVLALRTDEKQGEKKLLRIFTKYPAMRRADLSSWNRTSVYCQSSTRVTSVDSESAETPGDKNVNFPGSWLTTGAFSCWCSTLIGCVQRIQQLSEHSLLLVYSFRSSNQNIRSRIWKV